MTTPRPRVLLLADEKGLAEVIHRGLAGLPGTSFEVEVILEPSAIRRLTAGREYDLVVAGSRDEPGALELARWAPAGSPAIAVGGPPNGHEPPLGIRARVPLPLSYRLLRSAVADALGARALPPEEDRRRRDSVG